jgi:hypothetical protein
VSSMKGFKQLGILRNICYKKVLCFIFLGYKKSMFMVQRKMFELGIHLSHWEKSGSQIVSSVSRRQPHYLQGFAGRVVRDSVVRVRCIRIAFE